jgi:hypothetical protein
MMGKVKKDSTEDKTPAATEGTPPSTRKRHHAVVTATVTKQKPTDKWVLRILPAARVGTDGMLAGISLTVTSINGDPPTMDPIPVPAAGSFPVMVTINVVPGSSAGQPVYFQWTITPTGLQSVTDAGASFPLPLATTPEQIVVSVPDNTLWPPGSMADFSVELLLASTGDPVCPAQTGFVLIKSVR